MSKQRTWFITGMSSGIGRELTKRLLERGDRVAATLPDAVRRDDLKSPYAGLWMAQRIDSQKARAESSESVEANRLC